MVFSSFTFLCFFLPAVFLLHVILPDTRSRNLLLMLASLVFYACGEPFYVLLLLGITLINYGFGILLGKKPSGGMLALAVILDLGFLCVFKYTGFLAESINGALPTALLPVPKITLPIGISFYTFQILSYIIDVYRGEVRYQRHFTSLLLYVSFFPQLIAGPIVKYHDVAEQIKSRTITSEGTRDGFYRFLTGLGKKILIANGMAYVADTLFALKNDEWGLLSAWLAGTAYFLQIYFDFSGYSDMAIGLGRIFGFRFQENFNYPYTAFSVQEFWRRWHISLSTWFKEYLYIPLGGNRKGKFRTYLNLYIVFFATGIWHGANWTFLVWGLYHGTFLVLERIRLIPFGKIKSRVFGRIYTVFVALIGFVIFRADNLPQAAAVIRAMFGAGAKGGAGYAAAAQFMGLYYLLLFGAAILGATPLFSGLWKKLRGKLSGDSLGKVSFELLSMILSLLVLLLCYLQLASDSYNPFIYFRF